MPRPPAPPSPEPAAFPFDAFLSGNFDHPHATTSPRAAPRNNADEHTSRREQPRGSGVRERDETGRRRYRLTGSALPQPPPGTLGQIRRVAIANRDPTSALNNRPRATPSARHLRRSHRSRSRDMDSTADIRDSLNDIPVMNPFSAAQARGLRSPTDELADTPRRQTKRRKLGHAPTPPSPWNGFKYGHKGQVVPGRLKMEIVSCDGGEYDKHSSYKLYPIQNVLKNDKSVYCSERSSCNLLLRHIGEMPFTLEKVVIRAPNRGFTAPYVSQHWAFPLTNTFQCARRPCLCSHVLGQYLVRNIELQN